MSLTGDDTNCPSAAEHVTAEAKAKGEAAAAAGNDEPNIAAAEGEPEVGPSSAAAAPASLPRGVVKRIMMCDQEVKRASADAVWLVGHAAELLLGMLAVKCSEAAARKKRRTIKLEDFEHVVR